MHSLDVFESTLLFQKLWPKLLKSYALDAANNASDDSAPQKVAKHDDARKFLAEVAAAQAKGSDTSDALILSRRESDRVMAFAAHDPLQRHHDADNPAPAGVLNVNAYGTGGSFGGAIHSSGFSK